MQYLNRDGCESEAEVHVVGFWKWECSKHSIVTEDRIPLRLEIKGGWGLSMQR